MKNKKPKIPSDIKKEIIGWIISGKRLNIMKDIIYYIIKVLVKMSKIQPSRIEKRTKKRIKIGF